VWAEHVANLIVDDNVMVNPGYAGVLVLNGIGGDISRNLIQRVGPQTLWKVGDPEVDAYGIAFVHGDLSSGFKVDANVIEDVPQWQGINAHNLASSTWTNNVVRRVRRAYWLAPTSVDAITSVTVSGNRAESALSAQPTAFFVSNSSGVSFTSNFVSSTYQPSADGPDGSGCTWRNLIRDYAPCSVNLIRSGNALTP
jgi:hypothetical protein